MAVSDEWTEWHLTPRGWERGSRKVDFQGKSIKDAPDDRFLTYKYYEMMSGPFSKLEKGIEKIWESDDETNIAELVAQFGGCPESI